MAPERRIRGTTRSQKLELRGDYVVRTWNENPRLRRSEIHARVMAEFGCGIGAADDAIQRAYTMLAELRQDPALADRIASAYLEISDEAKRAKDWRGAVRALDSLRAHLGLGEPDRVQHTGSVELSKKYEELTDEELAALAKLDRAS